MREVPGVQRSEGRSYTNPVTPPQPDWEHKHDEAALTRVPDQILEENNGWRPRNVFSCQKERQGGGRTMRKTEDTMNNKVCDKFKPHGHIPVFMITLSQNSNARLYEITRSAVSYWPRL